MFAVTTTTNVASTAKQCFSGKKTRSSRKSFSSIVKASSSSEEKFDRREMLKNALVASVATVVATPKPVRANESSSQSSFRLLCAERSLSLYLFLSRGSFARFYSSLSWIALDFWISLRSLREVEKESKSSFSGMRTQYFSSFFFSFFIKN